LNEKRYNTPPPKLLKNFSYTHFLLKRKLEAVFIFPFIIVGRLVAKLKPQKAFKIYFFFPFYHTGGAEMVHAQIAKACGSNDCIIYFTRKSTDNRFFKTFEATGCTIKNISAYTDNKWLYFFNLIYRGIVSGYINAQQTKPIVFNGQCNFAYKISPWINKNVKQVELIHSFNSFSWIRLPFLPFITQTIMISKLRIEQHKEQYKNLAIPVAYENNIQFIQNAIELPENFICR
jgi:L-malate glycosyltransferase